MNTSSLIRPLLSTALSLGLAASLGAGSPGGGMGGSASGGMGGNASGGMGGNASGGMGGNASGGMGGNASGRGMASSGAMGGKMSPGDMLAKNPKLSSNLQGLFPPGTDLQQASKGFKNLGQFVAAAHVSKNLGIPFDQLKAAMVDGKLDLGQAIHKLKPDADAPAEAKKGMSQAMKELS